MKGRVRVIVGFAESFSAPEVVWSIKDQGFSIMALARRSSNAAVRVSRYGRVLDLTPPETNVAATVRELESEIAHQLQPGSLKLVLLPLDDAAMWVFGQVKRDERVIVVGGNARDSDFGLDKGIQVAHAREASFNVPRTALLQREQATAAFQLRFPVILKPARAISLQDGKLVKRRFHYYNNPEELETAVQRGVVDEPMLAQEYIAGVGEGLFGLATSEGVRAWSAHRRIRMMNPAGSGASACVSTLPQQADVSAASGLISQVSWRGPFMVELLRDPLGKSWFIEFNGRVWGSTSLARRCGMEYPAWAVLEAVGLGADIPQSSTPQCGVICRHAGREVLHALFVIRGADLSSSPRRWPARWQTVRQLLRFRKSEHWYNWRRDDYLVFFKDFFATMSEVVFGLRPARRRRS